jgi:CheY-like chemotaxis protein
MKNVLIVDDEPIVLDVLDRILTRIGYRTTITDYWAGALDEFSSKDFDLVLLDVLMPGKNGIEIARMMKLVKFDQIIILVTGLDPNSVMLQAGLECVDINGVISKPFSIQKVRTAVSGILDTKEICHQNAALPSI